MRRFAFLALLAALPVRAQQAAVPIVPEQSAPAPAPSAADVLALGSDIPGRMTVPVTIGAKGPYPFTIDTGAERTVLSRELAALLRLAPGPSVRLTAMTGSTRVDTAIIPALGVSIARAQRIEAPLLDGRNLGAPGLLGIDVLQDHAVSIDFERGAMRLVRNPRRARPEPGRTDEIVVTARSKLGQLVVADATVGGRRLRVVLDTGSPVSIGNGALRELVVRRGMTLAPITVTSVTGAALVADYTQISEVRLGSATIVNMPIAFADAAPFRRLGLDRTPAVLLGMDALRLFRRVDIDFANREVRLALPRS